MTVLEKVVDVRLATKRVMDMAFMLENQLKNGDNDFELFGTLNTILRLNDELTEEVEQLNNLMNGDVE